MHVSLSRRRPSPTSWAGTILSAVLGASLLLLLFLPLYSLFTFAPWSTLVSEGSDAGVQTAIGFTLYASGIAVGLTLVLGVPLGYLLARRNFPGKSIVEAAVTLPLAVPHLIVGLALLFLLAPGTPLGSLADRLGVPVFGTIWGVVLVMVYVSAPYTVFASQIAFRAVDERLLEASRCLGATPSQSFATVTVPLAARGIVSGGLLSWARSVSEIGGFLILAYSVRPSPPYYGPETSPISVYIYNLYQIGTLPGAAAVSSLFLLIAFAIFLAVRLAERAGRLPALPGGFFP